VKILPPTDEAILFAADALRSGELIGLPTETVYGIAADAANQDAILKTFSLKGRPAENPLIVHVSSLVNAEPLVSAIPESARRLAKTFWPGPLTLVLPKSSKVPNVVTGGLDTVAIRVPRHPVALAILEAAGMALTAPSANPFMGLSPTRADHIAPDVLAGLACVVDGGPCDVGVESTVVDCSGDLVSILRPGGVSRAMIEIMLGEPVLTSAESERRSPGMYRRHYSPKTPLRLVEKLGPFDAGVGFDAPLNSRQIQLPLNPQQYARHLYESFYTLDQMARLELLVESPPKGAEWEAVWDRLKKAVG